MATEFTIADRYRGDTIEFDFRVTKGGIPVDISVSDVKLWFTAKSDINSDDSQGIQKTKGAGIGIIDGPDGRGRVRLAPADTAILVMSAETLTLTCDLQIKEADNDVYTIAFGTITLKRDVSRDYA